MRRKTVAGLIAVLLSVTTLPGCFATASQWLSWTTGAKGLAGVVVSSLVNSLNLNPNNDPNLTPYITLATTVATDLVSNGISQQIPLDPGSTSFTR